MEVVLELQHTLPLDWLMTQREESSAKLYLIVQVLSKIFSHRYVGPSGLNGFIIISTQMGRTLGLFSSNKLKKKSSLIRTFPHKIIHCQVLMTSVKEENFS